MCSMNFNIDQSLTFPERRSQGNENKENYQLLFICVCTNGKLAVHCYVQCIGFLRFALGDRGSKFVLQT